MNKSRDVLNPGVMEMLKPPYPYNKHGLVPSSDMSCKQVTHALDANNPTSYLLMYNKHWNRGTILSSVEHLLCSVVAADESLHFNAAEQLITKRMIPT